MNLIVTMKHINDDSFTLALILKSPESAVGAILETTYTRKK